MPIKVVIEFQAQAGARAELKKMLSDISATHGPQAPGFLGSDSWAALSTRLDSLVEIADWDSADAQEAAVQQAMSAGVYAPVAELGAAPFRATRIGQP
jgi:hypothetical protein